MNENYSGKPAYDQDCELSEEEKIILPLVGNILDKCNATLDNMNKGIELTLKECKEVREEYKRSNPIL